MNVVTVNGWISFTEKGAARWSKGEPSLGRHERAIQISLKVPAAIFRTPSLRATIQVPADAVAPAIELDASTVADAIKQITGLDVALRVIHPDEESQP